MQQKRKKQQILPVQNQDDIQEDIINNKNEIKITESQQQQAIQTQNKENIDKKQKVQQNKNIKLHKNVPQDKFDIQQYNTLEQIQEQLNIIQELQKQQIEQENNDKQERHTCKFWLPRISLIVLIIGLVIFLVLIRENLKYQSFISWVQMNPFFGICVVIFVLIMATILFIPGILLTIATGYALFQVYNDITCTIVIGSISVWIGSQIGAIVALILGRYVFRQSLEKRKYKWKYFYAIDKAIEKQGVKMLFLLRLSPLTPFNIFNYLCGLTAITLPKFTVGGLGMIPAICIYVNVGRTLKNITQLTSGDMDKGYQDLIILVIGTLLSILVICIISYYSKKELHKYLQIQDSEISLAQKKQLLEEKYKIINNQNQEQNNNNNVQIIDINIQQNSQKIDENKNNKNSSQNIEILNLNQQITGIPQNIFRQNLEVSDQ